MTTENILEQIRDGQAQEEGLKKRFGGYRTKEVDQYVEKLLNRLHNMETVYQERCEEMRTHLRGVTREREELAERTRELEKQLADLPKRVDAYLAEQGLVALPKKEYEQLRSAGAELKTEVACLGEEKERLIAEQKRILKELEEAQASQRIDEQTLDDGWNGIKAEASEALRKMPAPGDGTRGAGGSALRASGPARGIRGAWQGTGGGDRAGTRALQNARTPVPACPEDDQRVDRRKGATGEGGAEAPGAGRNGAQVADQPLPVHPQKPATLHGTPPRKLRRVGPMHGEPV